MDVLRVEQFLHVVVRVKRILLYRQWIAFLGPEWPSSFLVSEPLCHPEGANLRAWLRLLTLLLAGRVGALLHLLLYNNVIGPSIVLANFGVGGAKVVDPAYVDLASRILLEVVHNVISNVLNGAEAAQRDTADRIDADMVEQSNGYRIADVFEDLLSERRAVGVCVDFRLRICDRILLF